MTWVVLILSILRVWTIEQQVKENENIDAYLTLLDSAVNGSSEVSWRYQGISRPLKSSLTILSGSFLSNRTYQLMVQLTNQADPSRQGTGFLLLRIVETFSPMIVISSATSALLISNSEYQLINPMTQLSLVAHCAENCSSTQKPNISWNIYQGKKNLTQWILVNQTDPLNFFG